MKKQKGFNLIELLIAVSIIGILSAICLPLFSHHIIKERRLEAAVAMHKLAVAFEHFYVVHHSYKTATLKDLAIPEKIADNRYQLIIAAASDSDFKLQAKPLGDQAKKDPLCGILTLDSHGNKSISGSGKLTDCW